MKAFQINSIKEFMNLLLRSEAFDHFLLSEASIHGAAAYHIDGHILPDFYSQEELDELGLSGLSCLPYDKLRPICFEMIKGRRTPSYFKFILMLSPENEKNTIKAAGTSITDADVSAIFFNILYQNSQLVVTTGISYRTFVQDKSFDREWDRFAAGFLTRHSILFSEI